MEDRAEVGCPGHSLLTRPRLPAPSSLPALSLETPDSFKSPLLRSPSARCPGATLRWAHLSTSPCSPRNNHTMGRSRGWEDCGGRDTLVCPQVPAPSASCSTTAEPAGSSAPQPPCHSPPLGVGGEREGSPPSGRSTEVAHSTSAHIHWSLDRLSVPSSKEYGET